nr:translation initiation factor IF-2-like [Taeniopygia guttata]
MESFEGIREESVALDVWREVLKRKRVPFYWDDFERLFLWAREQGFFPNLAEALSWENWSPVGDRLLDALLDNRFEDVGPLMMLFKRLDAIWQGSEVGSSRASLGDLSVLDADAGEAESLYSCPDSPSPGGSEPEGGSSSGVARAPRPLTSGIRSVEPVRPPRPAPRRRRSGLGGKALSLCAFPALGGERGPVDQPPPRIASDSVTVNCPNCGVTFPLGKTQAHSPGPVSGSSSEEEPAPIPEPARPAGHAQAVGAAKGGALVTVPSDPAPAGGQPAPSRLMGAVPTGRLHGAGPTLLGGVPDSLVSSRGDVSPRAASPSSPRPSPVPGDGSAALGLRSAPPPAPAAVPSADTADSTAGAPAGSVPPSPPAAGAGTVAQRGAGVFTFSATADAAGGRPVTPRGRGSSQSTLWTLPACQVTVRPKDHGRFWQEVLDKAEEMCDFGPSRSLPDQGESSSGSADAAGGVVSGDVAPPRSPGAASVPEATGHDTVDNAALPGGPQAFPVLRGVTHNTHEPFSFKVLKEIQDTVAQYGVGSAEVMQTIRLLAANLLTPFDIRSVAQALFDPVEFDVFEDKWAALVAGAVRKNATRGQQDPRRVATADMLMGTVFCAQDD